MAGRCWAWRWGGVMTSELSLCLHGTCCLAGRRTVVIIAWKTTACIDRVDLSIRVHGVGVPGSHSTCFMKETTRNPWLEMENIRPIGNFPLTLTWSEHFLSFWYSELVQIENISVFSLPGKWAQWNILLATLQGWTLPYQVKGKWPYQGLGSTVALRITRRKSVLYQKAN